MTSPLTVTVWAWTTVNMFSKIKKLVKTPSMIIFLILVSSFLPASNTLLLPCTSLPHNTKEQVQGKIGQTSYFEPKNAVFIPLLSPGQLFRFPKSSVQLGQMAHFRDHVDITHNPSSLRDDDRTCEKHKSPSSEGNPPACNLLIGTPNSSILVETFIRPHFILSTYLYN